VAGVRVWTRSVARLFTSDVLADGTSFALHMVPDVKIETFLDGSGPLIRRRDLDRAGQRTLESAVAAGVLVRLLPGTYTYREGAADLAVRALAVSRWQPDAVVTGRAAARLSFWPALPVGVIEVARRAHPPSATGYRFHQRLIDPDFVVRVGGVRMSAPALTALDLVQDVGGDAIDTCLRSRAVRLDDLWSAFKAHPDRPGNTARRWMLLDSRDKPWSAAERLSHRLLRDAHIQGWTANHRVVVGGKEYFIDIAFRGERLAIEIDGRLHEEDPNIFENDRRRQNGLVVAGWRVLRFTYWMLVNEPDYVISTILTELARRHVRV
jgi:very-short-patch-repair endonuclease